MRESSAFLFGFYDEFQLLKAIIESVSIVPSLKPFLKGSTVDLISAPLLSLLVLDVTVHIDDRLLP